MMKKIVLFALFLCLIDMNFVLAADCTEVGKRVATQQGGMLARSVPIVQDGYNMCVVVVVVPAHHGERPRRIEVTVPAD
ncbi:hypothetical protein [Bartonella sp. A05]|uniref:hypothetical protein n=1 Tax=Bartonella sp. A05 TaxID=2967261 RepID=UPI0022A9B1DB|nr:hypothetical protein [Bartonella sp. A05]MCZ2203853.1 hypothetical protein [Bartonella sp. A05]